MVFDYEADCSYNTKMLLLPYTSNCGECGGDFGRGRQSGGLCAAVTLPFCSSARIGIIPRSLLNQGLSLLFPTPPPRPVSFSPTQRLFSLLSKQPYPATVPCPTRCLGWKQDCAQPESGGGKTRAALMQKRSAAMLCHGGPKPYSLFSSDAEVEPRAC